MSASCILTYRQGEGDDGARRANLDSVLARLARSPAIETIVIEQDSVPRLAGTLPHADARTVFVRNPGAFNKGWGMNIGARAVAGSILVFADADVLVGASLERAIALCASEFALVKPYVRLADLTKAQTVLLQRDPSASLTLDAATLGRDAIGESIVLCGGVFVIRRDAFVHIGGFDERFLGWGGEDDAMTIKVERARLSCVELDDEIALHLWHPRPRATTRRQPHYAQNVALLRDYAHYSDTELARLAEVQWARGGNPRKYQASMQ